MAPPPRLRAAGHCEIYMSFVKFLYIQYQHDTQWCMLTVLINDFKVTFHLSLTIQIAFSDNYFQKPIGILTPTPNNLNYLKKKKIGVVW